MSYGISRYSLPNFDPISTIPADHCVRIIKDLMKKRPLGPVGVLASYKDDALYQPEHLSGYSPLIIFRLGIRDKDTLKIAICNIVYPGCSEEEIKVTRRSGTITRYLNRVWPIIRSAVLGVKSGGASGLYEVYDCRFSALSYGIIGYVYADDMSTARIIGKTLFGYMMTDGDLRVRFIEWENRECLDILNIGLMASLSERTNKLVEKKENLEKVIEHNKSHIKALSNILCKNQD